MKPAFVTLIFVLMSSVLGLLAFAIEVSSDFLAKREMENVKLRCCAVLARTFVVEDNSRPVCTFGNPSRQIPSLIKTLNTD